MVVEQNLWVQVKQRDKVGRPDIDHFEAAMIRSGRKKGYSVGFSFSSDSMTERSQFFKREHISIIALTVQEILDEGIYQKLGIRALLTALSGESKRTANLGRGLSTYHT